MTGGPAFAMVFYDEAGAYGGDAAIMLAHIRFRCQRDGDNRVVVDGRRYWRAPFSVLAHECRTSKSAAHREMTKLTDSGAVLAKRLGGPGDQTWSYHAPARDDALTGHFPESGHPDMPFPDSGTTPSRFRDDPVPIPGNVLLPKEIKEGEEGGGSSRRSADSLDAGELANSEPATPDPGQPRDAPQPLWTQSRNNGHVRGDTTAGDDSTPPSPYCRRHPNGTKDDCGPCGDARKLRKARDAEQSERAHAVRAAGLAAIEACPACDPNGFVELDTAAGTSVRRCDLHPSKADLPTVTP